MCTTRNIVLSLESGVGTQRTLRTIEGYEVAVEATVGIHVRTRR